MVKRDAGELTSPPRLATAEVATLVEHRRRVLGRVLQGWDVPLWCAAAIMAGLIIPLRYVIGQNADGLLQTLMSIQHLTIFYWQQDRFANLLPLIASPIADPAINAQVQLGLRIGLGVAAPLLFCVTGGSGKEISHAARMTVVASSLGLAAMPQQMLHEWFVEASPYGTSYALGGFALILLARAQAHCHASATACRMAGLLLTVAAYMVNASLVLLALPLFGARAMIFGSVLATEFCVASIVAILVTLLASNSVHTPKTPLRFGESMIGLQHYATELIGKSGYFLMAMTALFVLAAAFGRKPGRSAFLEDGVVLFGAFAVTYLGVSLSSWVQVNYFHPRYLVPLYVLMAAVGAKAVFRLVDRFCPSEGIPIAALGLCAALLAVAGHRKSTIIGDENTIVDAGVRPLAMAVAEMVSTQHLDAVAGAYWHVWPSVFMAEQQAHDRGHPAGSVYGLTLRGDTRRAALLARLSSKGELSIACIDLTDDACRDAAITIVQGPLQGRSVQKARTIEHHQVSIVSVINSLQ